MLHILRNKKAQTTAEYAILIGLVVAALIAMQTYVKRGLQGRMKDATDTFATETTNLGATTQYEPYYLNQASTGTSSSQQSEGITEGGGVSRTQNATSTRTGTQSYGW
ncbi:MAG: hypothetical protein WC723_02860 [Candidatus Omnitrophota bacterium]